MKTAQLIAVATLIVSVQGVSLASESVAAPKPIAIQLYNDAMSLFERGDYATACARFAESQHLDPQLGTLVHLADCYVKIGKTASAWALFREAAELADKQNDPRRALAHARVAELEPRVSRLTIKVGADSPPSLEIRNNGSPIGKALLGIPIPLDPGDYVLDARADGFEDWQRKLVIADDTHDTVVEIPPLAAKPKTLVATTESVATSPVPDRADAKQMPAPPMAREHGSRLRTLEYTLGAVGVVGIGVGIAAGIAKQAKQSDRDTANACSRTSSCTTLDKSKIDQLTEEARTRALVANIAFAAGGAALVTAAILIITGWPEGDTGPTAQVQPWIGDRVAGLSMRGSW